MTGMARLIRAIPRVLVKPEQLVIQRQFLNGIVHVFFFFFFFFFFFKTYRVPITS